MASLLRICHLYLTDFSAFDNEENEKIDGNGLGLAIVKPIIEQHGGEVSVESELQKGSCFSISLPLLTSSTKESTKVEAPSQEYANESLSPEGQAAS